jgi:hypothetical protein
VSKHPTFGRSEYRPLLGYLVSRSFIHELLSGRILSALEVISESRTAEALNFGMLSAIAFYARGKQIRKHAERRFRSLVARADRLTLHDPPPMKWSALMYGF